MAELWLTFCLQTYQNLKASKSKVKVKKENKLSDKFRIRMMLLLFRMNQNLKASKYYVRVKFSSTKSEKF